MWMHNPATGETGDFHSIASDGRRLDADLWLQPGAAVARAHVHDHLVERFEVQAGEVGFVAGAERVVRAVDGAVEVPAGTLHEWWNAGESVAHVRVTVTATPSAPGRPAERFVSMIEAIWSLGALGRVSAKGVPGPLWLAAFAHEYRDVIRFKGAPPALFAPLAAVARRTGRDPLAAELHGPTAACSGTMPGWPPTRSTTQRSSTRAS